jgi:hypothetical protein
MGSFNIKSFLVSSALDFIKVKADELIDKTVVKTANVVGSIAAIFFMSFTFALFAIFLGIGIAFFISELTGKTYIGFLVMAVIYLLLGWLFWALRKQLVSNPLRKALMRAIGQNKQ